MTDPTSLPNFPPPADEHPLRGRVLDVLVDMGAQPNLDTDGDVAYQANEQTIFVRSDHYQFVRGGGIGHVDSHRAVLRPDQHRRHHFAANAKAQPFVQADR